MYILDEGVGTWDGTIVNASNPQRRDTQLVQAYGYLVVQFDSTNPGKLPSDQPLPSSYPRVAHSLSSQMFQH